MEKKKMNKLLLISFIIGAAYLIYSIFYWSGALTGAENDTELIGSGLATALVMPHLIASAVAVLFNAIGLFMRKRGFALAGAILYTVAMLLFPMYFMFVIIETILSYIGYAKMKKE